MSSSQIPLKTHSVGGMPIKSVEAQTYSRCNIFKIARIEIKHNTNDREKILRNKVCTGFSVISVQRAFRNPHEKEAPTNRSILRWYNQFKKTGCLSEKKSSCRSSVLEEAMKRMRQSFVRSSQKSLRAAA
ncbi:hypothetical protein TNCV_1405251 [Trichonephila clavipes]|nr:hypothetical protein TNCV_1405251 [Trichonephila clavipes]